MNFRKMKTDKRKRLAKAIDKQCDKIDKARAKGVDRCKIVPVDDDIKTYFLRYLTEMIGYTIEDDMILFNHIQFVQDDNLFTEYIIAQ